MSTHLNVHLSVERPKNSPKCPSLCGEAGRGEGNFEFPNVLCKRKMWFPNPKPSETAQFSAPAAGNFSLGFTGGPSLEECWRQTGSEDSRNPVGGQSCPMAPNSRVTYQSVLTKFERDSRTKIWKTIISLKPKNSPKCPLKIWDSLTQRLFT